ncbi:MAG: radical SAM protein [Candidatus Adiutrix sp.]
MNMTNFKEKILNRQIYLRGARQLGFSLLKTLRREGLEPVAFLDLSPDLVGSTVDTLPVKHPSAILPLPQGTYFIIITSGFFYHEIAEEYRRLGLIEGQDFAVAANLQAFDYMIDVSGLCNLRCPSCPRGNFKPQPKSGFMTPDYFDLLLEKIIKDDPFVGAVALYQWGEPLLNKHLPEIIRRANLRGVRTALSSNLNIRTDFSEVIKAGPAWFRVSTSGWGQNYEQTHLGGNWELFIKNLHHLKQLAESFAPDMTIEVFYHIYKDRAADYDKMKQLCQSLGVDLRVRHAALAPLDNVADIVAGRPLNDEVTQVLTMQSLTIFEAMEIAKTQKDRPCPYARFLWITWDGFLPRCSEWFHPDYLLVDTPFLETPLAQIQEAFAHSPHCRFCKENAIHRCFVIYGDENLIEQRQSLSS